MRNPWSDPASSEGAKREGAKGFVVDESRNKRRNTDASGDVLVGAEGNSPKGAGSVSWEEVGRMGIRSTELFRSWGDKLDLSQKLCDVGRKKAGFFAHVVAMFSGSLWDMSVITSLCK